MINLEDLVLDVSLLSTVHPPQKKKVTPSMSKNVKTYGKSSEPIIPIKDKTVVEEESRSKGSEIRNPNVQTSLAKESSPDNDSSEKYEESVPEHVARERRTKRLQRRKGKAVVLEDSPSREVKRKSGGLKGTPSRSSIRKYPIGPTRSWSKVVIPTRNRKAVYSSESEFDVEKDVQDITLVKRYANKKPHAATPKAPLDNASLHYVKDAERWKYVIQRRVALEMELGKDALKCKEVVELTEVAGLMKTVTQFGPCYESLAKEFVVTIPDGCDDAKSADYEKVYVRGNVVTLSPAVINKFLGRTEVPQVELEVTNNQVCKEIMAKQVRHWPIKGKLSAGKLSVKYAILHRIGTANWIPTYHTSTIFTSLGKFIYAVGTRIAFDFGKYIFEQVLKQAFSTAVKMPICFQSLICGIILSQHPGILLPIDSVKKKDSPLSLHYKLFAGTHVPDIVLTYSQLKETCKELEDSIGYNNAAKIKLEILMKAIMEEEKKEVVQDGDDNEGTDDDDYAGEDDADEEKEDKGEEYAIADSDSQEDI
ncbi:uncharacterized protein LOC127078725 [Lathyrus oleraceus]|uniref:uncharacterized protein LOC127078725 n=1 Tax=Pisum sativum TaxID=3888 RepID=UPI0021D2009F|nr:uncharacterized protein LOC127078725 [Pisum sativum]